MPAPPGRQIQIARDGDPARKSARRDLPVLAGRAEHACRVEGMAEDHRFSDGAALHLVCQDRHDRMVKIGSLADIECGMGVEDL
jgi:hypothetical protein